MAGPKYLECRWCAERLAPNGKRRDQHEAACLDLVRSGERERLQRRIARELGRPVFKRPPRRVSAL